MITFHNGSHEFHGPVSGRDTHLYQPAPRAADERPDGADLGVLITLTQERRAVIDALAALPGYATHRTGNGPLLHEARLPAGHRSLRVVALQSLQPGPLSAALAHEELVRRHRPAVVLLVGIAGAVSDRVRVGDVVLSDMVISYDPRRETPDGPALRGQAQTVTVPLGHRLNDFMADTGGRMRDALGAEFRIHRGPIGSGSAVITDADSRIRTWLRTVNERVLAVETEAAGVAQAFHESAGPPTPFGWLTVRGISDAADVHKPAGDDHHDLASRRAAQVLLALAPHLAFAGV